MQLFSAGQKSCALVCSKSNILICFHFVARLHQIYSLKVLYRKCDKFQMKAEGISINLNLIMQLYVHNFNGLQLLWTNHQEALKRRYMTAMQGLGRRSGGEMFDGTGVHVCMGSHLTWESSPTKELDVHTAQQTAGPATDGGIRSSCTSCAASGAGQTWDTAGAAARGTFTICTLQLALGGSHLLLLYLDEIVTTPTPLLGGCTRLLHRPGTPSDKKWKDLLQGQGWGL
jgi:hypothetical protein